MSRDVAFSTFVFVEDCSKILHQENLMERREFIKTASLTSAATLVSQSFAGQNESTKLVLNGPFLYEHKPMKLNFDPTKSRDLSAKLINSHLDNNYGGSVKALNEVRKKVNELRKAKDIPPYVYNDLKREHLMRTGSVINHELYFNNLGGNGKASGAAEKYITKAFGSFSAWEEEFRKIAAGLGGGPGWVILGYNHQLKSLENYWSYDHMHGLFDTSALLVMDMYEHSYQIDYGAAAAKYIDAFFLNINWDEVNKRFEALS
jgi:superoxide dismutase, Fe-Mn family